MRVCLNFVSKGVLHIDFYGVERVSDLPVPYADKLIKNLLTMFFGRIKGNSMGDARL